MKYKNKEHEHAVIQAPNGVQYLMPEHSILNGMLKRARAIDSLYIEPTDKIETANGDAQNYLVLATETPLDKIKMPKLEKPKPQPEPEKDLGDDLPF